VNQMANVPTCVQDPAKLFNENKLLLKEAISFYVCAPLQFPGHSSHGNERVHVPYGGV